MIYRHLRNIDELIFWTSLSCLLSLLGRLSLAFLFPTLLLRVGVGIYVWQVIGKGEGQRLVAGLICGALVIGFIGGTWDGVVYWAGKNFGTVRVFVQLTSCLALIVLGLWLIWERGGHGKSED